MKIKNYLKNNMIVLVLLLTFFTKVLEWGGGYLISNPSFIIDTRHMVLQVAFIINVAVVLLIGFNYMKVKKKTYLLIPVLSYFIKEVFNFLFIYGRIINEVTIIALVLEPLMLYGLIHTLNKYWLKLK